MEQIYSACCTTLLIYSSVSRRKEDTNTTLHSRCSSFFFFLFCSDLGYTCAYVCACVCVCDSTASTSTLHVLLLWLTTTFRKPGFTFFAVFFFSVCFFLWSRICVFYFFLTELPFRQLQKRAGDSEPCKGWQTTATIISFLFLFLHPASTFCRRFLFL